MPKQSVETLCDNIESLSHEGRGVARINGKTTFIRGALPGETVRARLTKRHRQYDEASVVSVETAAADRIEARCQHFGVCGGCSLQHLSSEHQIEHKQSVLLEHFQHYANTQPKTLLAPLAASPWHYRGKARLGVRYVEKKGGILLGFREAINPRFLTAMEECPILDERITACFPDLKACLNKVSIRAEIPQIEIAVGDTQVAFILRHMQPLSADDIELLVDFAKAHQIWFYCQPKKIDSIYRLWPEDTGELMSYQLPDFNVSLQFHPNDFTQVNAPLNRLMVTQAINELQLSKDDDVLDLFCGLGNFTLPMATLARHVTGVEGSELMVERASRNAELNQLSNTEFYAADLFKECRYLPWAKRQYAKLLLDPPRTGAAEIIPLLSIWQPQRIVYVSCNPATLARDSELIEQQGYQLVSAGVMDMFPHTAHVESMAVFTKCE